MRLVMPLPILIILSGATFALGVYAGAKRVWPLPQLKRLLATEAQSLVRTDQFGRLLSYPGKIEIACPIQDEKTAVLLLVGQSNAANYQGQRYQSADDRVVNFLDGRCYRAASPLLGADGQRGEPWTLLGNKLVQSGLYHTVILVPAAVGGSSVRRWAAGGDLNAMLMAVITAVKARYTINAVLLDQGTTDFVERMPEGEYRSDLKSMIDSVRTQGVHAPFFITRSTAGPPDWTEDNPVARAQATLADSRNAVFDGPNTDRDVTPLDRYDGYHYGASGQEKFTDAWMRLLQAREATSPSLNPH
jgi:Carbohydrate esterase, sialic acid-specific acetylesterase